MVPTRVYLAEVRCRVWLTCTVRENIPLNGARSEGNNTTGIAPITFVNRVG